MKKFINKERLTENRVYIILGLVIFIQLAFIIYGFQFKKVGYHSDELWSYGYANSYYQKDIFQDNEGNLININEWTKGQVLKDYIVVNKGEEFSYGSIYQNQMYDLSPPLHSMVLHTICSFFPERYSRWFSFSINIISFIICLIFLFKTARLLKDDVFALCCCIVYGFSLGARDTYVYLRMYGMCAALVMIIIYNFLLYLKRIKEDGKIINKNLAGICVASFAGFLTHYYMIALVGILTFFVCALLLFKKKFKVMFAYGFSLLGTLLLSLATFPTLMHMAQSQSAKVVGETKQSMNYTFEIRFKIISNFLMTKLFDIPISIYSSGLLPIVMGCLVVFYMECSIGIFT